MGWMICWLLLISFACSASNQASESATPKITPAAAGPYHVLGNRILDAKLHEYLIRGTQLPPITLNAAVGSGNAAEFGPFSRTTLITVRQRLLKLNSDNNGALHLMLAICFLSDGSMVTSWFDRRNYPNDSSMTDYYGDVRPSPYAPASNFKITTEATDWLATSSIINPNFGDYTDNACTGMSAYFTWTDGRMGVAQPFVAP